MDYQTIEWPETQALEYSKIIFASSDWIIQKINLNSGKSAYLVPESFYLAARRALKEFNQRE